MPRITRFFIKSGIIYFLFGISLSLIAELPSVQTGNLLLPVYWHMLVIGWITQVIMGVSLWMFPRKQRGKRKEDSIPAVASFWLLNSGLILRFCSEPFLTVFNDSAWVASITVTSSLLQASAFVFYAVEIWPRVRTKNIKKKKG